MGRGPRCKAECPGAVPIAGGTDLMVDLNFDRRPSGRAARPQRRRGAAASGRGRTTSSGSGPGCRSRRIIAEIGVAGPWPGDRLAHGRLAADPQPGHARRPSSGRRRLPAMRCRRWSRGRDGGGRVGPRGSDRAGTRVLHRPEAQCAGAGRADPRRPGSGRGRAAAVREGRHAQRHGDLGVRVRPLAASARGRVGTCVGRPARRCCGRWTRRSSYRVSWRAVASGSRVPRWTGARRPVRRAGRPGRPSDRRRARHGQPTGVTPWGSWPGGPWAGRGTTTGRRAMRITFEVNGTSQYADDVWPGESLLYVLRERLGLPGTKNACEQGNAAPARSTSTAPWSVRVWWPHRRRRVAGAHCREVWPRPTVSTRCSRRSSMTGAVQCGFCTPGPDPRDRRPAGPQPAAGRRRDPRSPCRQPVSLHGVREDPRCGPAGVDQAGSRR